MQNPAREIRHEYKPIPLRWWYLGLVLVYAVAILALLEYALYALPRVENRRTLGTEATSRSSSNSQTAAQSMSQRPLPIADATPSAATTTTTVLPKRQAAHTEPGKYFNYTDMLASMNLTTSTFTRNQTLGHANDSTHGNTAIDTKLLHLDPGLYPQLGADLVIARFRMSATWIHSPNGRDILPVPYGMDLSMRCIMYSVQVYFTDDPNDCQGTFRRDYTRYGRYEKDLVDPDFGSIYYVVKIDDARCEEMYVAYKNLPFLGNDGRAKDDCYVEEEEMGFIFQHPVKSPEGTRIILPKFNMPTVLITGQTFTIGNPMVWATLASPNYLGTRKSAAGPDMEAVETWESTARKSAHIAPGDPSNYYYIEGRVTTLTNKYGTPISTATRLLGDGRMPPRTTKTLTGTDGQATATITTDLGLSAVTTTFYSSGIPYSTATLYGIPYPTSTSRNWTTPPESAIRVVPMTAASYFAGSFLPVILTTLLGVLVQAIHRSILAMLPFRALSRRSLDGVKAQDSLQLNTRGAPWHAVRLAWKFQDPLPALSYLLSTLSLVLTGLSGEAVGLTLRGDCVKKTFHGCFMSLAVVTGAARVGEVTAAAVCVTLSLLGLCILLTWRVGTSFNPRNIIATAGLLAGKDRGLRDLMLDLDTPTRGGLVSAREMKACFGEHRRFSIRFPEGTIVQTGEDTTQPEMRSGHAARRERPIKQQCRQDNQHRTALLVGYGLSILFLGVISGLLAVVAYYGSAQLGWDSSFERFMDSQTFGVTFLFTAVGAVIALFWDHFFHATETVEPYCRLSGNKATLADLHITRSSNIFSGFFRTVIRKDLFVGAVAFTGVSAKCLPICLANIPFSLILTWNTYITCTRIALTILSLMIVVLLASFLRRQPYMPANPNTMVGCMYYICDSRMLDDIQQLAELAKLGARFRFGKMIGSSGSERIGIDYHLDADREQLKTDKVASTGFRRCSCV